MERISVAIRVRPPIKQEFVKGNQWKVGAKTIALYNVLGMPVPGQAYTFDHVFFKDAKNSSVYEIHTREVILSALQGFNGTVFAYGQTSSGKTYTMRGSERDPGIIHRAVCDVFSNIENIHDREFLIRVSYMEIYKEEINDLLAPENRKLRIHENSVRGIFVAGLREEIVSSPDQVFDFLRFGEANRHFGKTNMNAYSSRSHTVFRMVIESRDKTKDNECSIDTLDAVRVSTVNMVDLAGSERIAKTGAGGVRLKEGSHINRSLMTLGTVINKLSEAAGKQGGHIPYRDSKLTRILQSALDGNAKTAVICTVTPDEMQLDETRGTLQFASRAKRVSTCAQVNETITDAALLKRQKKEIEELRQKLQGTRSEILEKEILNLRNDLLKFELERERLTLELEEEKKAQKERELRIKEQERKIENLSTLVISSAWEDRKPTRKSNRRETWCPRWASPKSVMKDYKNRYEAESPSLVSTRRDTDVTPLAFETLFDEDADAPCSTRVEEETQTEALSVPSDFENIADEETWISMNKGHPGFDATESSHSVSSTGSADVAVSKDSAFSELQLQYDELKNCLLTKDEELARTRMQLDALMQEKHYLKEDLLQELQFRRELEKLFAEMEREVIAGKLHAQTVEEALNDSRASVFSCVQEFKTAAKYLMCGKNGLANLKAKPATVEAQDNFLQGLKSPLVRERDGCDMQQQEYDGTPSSYDLYRASFRHKIDKVDENDQKCSSVRRSGRKSLHKSFFARLLELEETEKHLRQILQQSMAQLLESQNANNLLLTENVSLLNANTKLQTAVDAMWGKAAVLKDRVRASETEIKRLKLSAANNQRFSNHSQSFWLPLHSKAPMLLEMESSDTDDFKVSRMSLTECGLPILIDHEGVEKSCVGGNDEVEVHVLVRSQPFGWNMTEREMILAFNLILQTERFRAVEADLAAAQLEIVELKVDAEATRALVPGEQNVLLPAEVDPNVEVQMLRRQCELYEEEIKLILEQVPTAEEEAMLRNVLQENCSLRKALVKSQRRADRYKDFRKKKGLHVWTNIQHVTKSSRKLEEGLAGLEELVNCIVDMHAEASLDQHKRWLSDKFAQLKFELVGQRLVLSGESPNKNSSPQEYMQEYEHLHRDDFKTPLMQGARPNPSRKHSLSLSLMKRAAGGEAKCSKGKGRVLLDLNSNVESSSTAFRISKRARLPQARNSTVKDHMDKENFQLMQTLRVEGNYYIRDSGLLVRAGCRPANRTKERKT